MNIGVLGTGQLAYLFCLEAEKCGHVVVPFGPKSTSILELYSKPIYKDYSDRDALREFLSQIDVLTYETENIELEVLEFCASYVKVFPSVNALKVSQDRLYEKNLFNSLHIPTNDFYPVSKIEDLLEAANQIAFPAIIKTRTQGYDGKGQFVVKNLAELQEAWGNLQNTVCILESFVNYQREVSIIAARDVLGNIVFFPLTQNYHRQGILRYSFPQQEDPLQKQAELYASNIINHLDYVGCMALEFFDVDGQLIANEMAPRVHNSGHWTIEGASKSQFELHLRAIAGEKLTKPIIENAVVSANIIGAVENKEILKNNPNTRFYDYGKSLKENRKMGHFTIIGAEVEQSDLLEQLATIFEMLGEKDLSLNIKNFLSNTLSN